MADPIAGKGATSEDASTSALGADADWSRRVRRFRSGLLGGIAAAAPSAIILTEAGSLRAVVALVIASVLLAATARHQGRGGGSRVGVAAATVAAAVALGPNLLDHPAWAFVLGLLAMTLGSWRRRPTRRGGLDAASRSLLPAWGALGPAWVVVGLAAFVSRPPDVFLVSATATTLFAAALGLTGLLRLELEPSRRRMWLILFGVAVLGGLAAPDLGLRSLLLVIAGSLALLADPRRQEEGGPFSGVLTVILGRPEFTLVVGFGAAIVFGSFALALPSSSATSASVAALDAFFTAVSATCVTGLIVVDTPHAFSGFGQAILLALIQFGGLGIMTFSTAALFLLRRRPSVRHERALADVFVSWEDSNPMTAVRKIFIVTFVTEGFGALFLAGRFATHYGETIPASLWRGLFTAVSAFCNAGFALQSDSLIPYQQDAFVTLVIAVIIFLGALGPVVVLALTAGASGRRRLSAQLVITTSLVLVIAGATLFAAFEWDASLASLSWPDRFHNALFQSVTLRTAGFNSVDFMALLPETRVSMLVFMFIGGAPGSTAGGIKTTTFAVILLSLVATVRGRPEVVLGGRSISHNTFYRATAIFVLGLLSVMVLWGLLLLTQGLEPLSALFEAVSALATVGLSVGATGDLDEVGKLLIAAGMFAGRLGPVTVLFLFASRDRPSRVKYPVLELPVG